MPDRFEIFLRCACGHQACVVASDYSRRMAFRCSRCGRTDPQVSAWPIWQRAMRRDGWSPWD